MNKFILATFLFVIFGAVYFTKTEAQLLRLPNPSALEELKDKIFGSGNNNQNSNEDGNNNNNNNNSNNNRNNNNGNNGNNNNRNNNNDNNNGNNGQGSQQQRQFGSQNNNNNDNNNNDNNNGNNGQGSQQQHQFGSRNNDNKSNGNGRYFNNNGYNNNNGNNRRQGNYGFNNNNNNNGANKKSSRNDLSQESSEDFSGEEMPTTINNLKKDANKFADETIQKLHKKIDENGLNQISLPDDSREFNRKFYNIRFDGVVALNHGYLKGFDNIRRISDATMRRHSNGSVTVSFDTEFGDLEVGYNLDLSFFVMKAIPTQRVKGYLSGVNAQFDVLVDKNGKVVLTDFDILDAGHFQFQTTGLGQLNFVLDSVVERVGNLSKRIVLESMEGKLQALLNAILNDSVYPVHALFASAQNDLYSKFTNAMSKVYG